MTVQVDLSQLATPRGGHTPMPAARRNRVSVLTRYVLPLVLVSGFLSTLAYTFRESLWEPPSVTVIPVMAVHAQIEAADAPLFQSAGWVEPRPTAVIVSALEEGVVEKLFAVEGQELAEGEVVARLIDADAKLQVREAEAALNSRLAELASSKATLSAAETRLREPVELQAQLAEAEALLAKTENDLARLPNQVEAAKSRLELAVTEKNSRTLSGEAVSKIAVARAINEFQTATAVLNEWTVQQSALEKEKNAHERRVAALGRQLELKIEEKRQHDEGVAAVALAESRVAQARVSVDAAKLRLDRLNVRAPVTGKVLALVARPGSKVMGLAPTTTHDASTVITMYDPRQLQVRADVRLEDVPQVTTGQQVKIETPAVKGMLDGRVIAATSTTDIQKNTLQVKVAIENPPAVLKPDMLVQVTFMSPPATKSTDDLNTRSVTLLIPPNLVRQNGDVSSVWIADRHHGIAVLRAVTLGGTAADGQREVKSGLALGDRLIVSGGETLQNGDRIRIAGEAAETPGNSTQVNQTHH